jgi:hypothetical protein
MIKQLLFIVIISCISLTKAQTFTVSGKITDAKDNSELIGVNVTITNVKDSTQTKGESTDLEGNFSIADVPAGDYVLNISYISYKTIIKFISVTENLDLKNIAMAEESKLLKEVVIEEKQIRVQQLGDTSQLMQMHIKPIKMLPQKIYW